MTAPERRLVNPSAVPGRAVDEATGVTLDSYNGRVELRALPAWLKSDRYVTAELTPREARKLAIQLLEAAERATMPRPVRR